MVDAGRGEKNIWVLDSRPGPGLSSDRRLQTWNRFNWVQDWLHILRTGVDRFRIRIMKVGTGIGTGYLVENLIF